MLVEIVSLNFCIRVVYKYAVNVLKTEITVCIDEKVKCIISLDYDRCMGNICTCKVIHILVYECYITN